MIPGFLFVTDANARDVKSSVWVIQKRDRRRGTPGGLALPDKGPGNSGDGCPYPVPVI